MVTKDKIYKIYEEIIDNKELTTKLLKECGFNSHDINTLLENGIIDRRKRGFYTFKDYDGLNKYGKTYIVKKNWDKGNKCFLKCFENNPHDMDIAFRILLSSINNEEYEKAIKICDVIINSENDYVADASYYMYLLSFLTSVPLKDEEYIKYLTFFEIKLDDSKNPTNNIYNSVRSISLKNKFSFALHNFNNYFMKKDKHSIQDIITKTLLVKVVKKESEFKKELKTYVNDKKYDVVLDLLKERHEKHSSNTIDIYIYKLVKIYLNISKTGNVPIKKIVDTNNSLEAIDAYDFDLALELDKKFYEEKNIPDENNILRCILQDIVALIKSIKDNNSTNNEDIDTEIKNNNPEQEKDYDNFTQIINYLMNNKIDTAFDKLKVYMNNIGKSEYEYLIINLIKLGLLEKDLAFVDAMAELSLMSFDDYNVNISKFLQKFYISVSNNNLSEARIYLDIIDKTNKLGISSINVNILSKTLDKNNSGYNNNYKKSSEIISNRQELNMKTIEKSNINEDIVNTPVNKYKVDGPNNLDKDKIMIDKKYDDLCENKGIILLKAMDSKRNDNILKIAKRYPNMTAFTIKDFGEERVVLKYQPVICDDINLDETINKAKPLFKNGKYEECIDKNLKILECLHEPTGINYAIIGLCYSKLSNKAMAIDYLTVANDIARKNHEPYDYSDLILYLRDIVHSIDRKPASVRMGEREFKDSCNNKYYGIDNFEEINSQICDSGLDVESACLELGLSDDEINIINLIYAKEFFLLGNNEKGELFLNYVIRKKDKSRKVINIISEITKNKSLYKKKTDSSIQLSYKLTPKKKK